MARFRIRACGILGILLTLFVTVVYSAAVSADLLGYPSILSSTVVVLFAGAVVIRTAGLISVPSLFWALIAYPMSVPFLADYVFDVAHYTSRATAYSQGAVVREGLFLVAVFTSLFASVVVTNHTVSTTSNRSVVPILSRYRYHFTTPAFVFIAAIVIVSAYLTTPGPTILTVGYQTVLNNYISWATFAGSLFMSSWVVLFLIYRSADPNRLITIAFAVISASCILWLVLHARRNESIGILLVLAVAYGDSFRVHQLIKSVKKSMMAGILLVLFISQVIVGELRAGRSLTDQSIRTLFVSDHPLSGEYIHIPGGAHNIYSTYQFTVSEFTNSGYLLGETFVRYPIQSVPTPILSVLPVSPPPYFNQYLATSWDKYPGGSFILNEYIANFGIAGVLFAALLIGVVATWTQLVLATDDSPTFWTGFAAAFVVVSTRVFWYHQINWVNVILGFIVTYVLYVVLTNSLPLIREHYGMTEISPDNT